MLGKRLTGIRQRVEDGKNETERSSEASNICRSKLARIKLPKLMSVEVFGLQGKALRMVLSFLPHENRCTVQVMWKASLPDGFCFSKKRLQ